MQPTCFRPAIGLPTRILAATIAIASSFIVSARAQIGGGPSAADVSPTMDTEVSTMIKTGCGYDAWTGSATRTVMDFEVPGAVSAHGLKWTRTYNSSTGLWSFAYTWRYAGKPWNFMSYPDGRSVTFNEVGLKDRLLHPPPPIGPAKSDCDVILEDGSDIHMAVWSEQVGPEPGGYWVDHVTPSYINDRYGRQTQLDWEQLPNVGYNPDAIHLVKVTDPSGRFITISYGNTDQTTPTEIDGSDGQWVKYTWVYPQANSPDPPKLTHVDYSDGTSADYTYGYATYTSNNNNPPTGTIQVLLTARDTRADSPMQSISYQYFSPGNWPGEVAAEHDDLNSNQVVSSPDRTIHRADTSGVRTETRGDGPSRHIRMAKPNVGTRLKQPPLVDYKEDYNGVQERYHYDPNKNYYLDSVTDRNGNTTNYTLEPVIGNPTRITHPQTASDSTRTYIDYTYSEAPIQSSDADNPYYVSAVTDENGKITKYTRDPNSHLITRIDYPDGALETFTYNVFGQVTKHQRKNGAFEYAGYDSTGLLIKLWNPTIATSVTDSDPHTTFAYYPAGNPWQDRVQTVTDQRGYRTTYEYDRDSNGNAVHGRGLVTKIRYPDDTHGNTVSGGTFKSFTYDIYGNKLSETNELVKTTNYTYDDYMRLTSVKLPNTTDIPNQPPTTYNYTATNGASPYTHTTKSVRYETSPTGIVTAQTFDNNFRLATRVEGAQDSSVAATTRYDHDPNGNLTTVTDPRGGYLGDPNHTTTTTYDARNRKQTVTDALNHTTTWHYDNPATDATRINRPDGTTETKTYDPMHRVWTDTVPQTSSINLTTKFVYNPSGTIQTVTDAKLQTNTFEYDPSDLKTKMTYPNGSEYQGWTYDNAKNLITRRTANGTSQSFTYDPRNREITMTWSNSADYANFDYDLTGRLTFAQNGTSTVTRQYDAAGRLMLDRQYVSSALGNKDVQYKYNADGRDTRLYLSSAGYDYTFGYEAMGRFEKIFATGGSSPQYQYYYDAASNEIERINNLNAVGQVYTPDNLNRISRRDVVKGKTTLSYEVYGYDPMNRLNSISREDGLSDSFTYYQDGELNTAQYGIAGSTPTPTPPPTPTPTATPAPTPTATPPPNQVAPVIIQDDGQCPTPRAYMSTATAGATIFYTMHNGSYVTPTHNGGSPTGTTQIYSGPIAVAGAKYFSALGYKSGMQDSGVSQDVVDSTGCRIDPASFTTTGSYPATVEVSISTDAAGATIFYTYSDSGYVPPTHDGPTPSGSTLVYTGPIAVAAGTIGYFGAVVYVDGVGDSDLSQALVDNTASAAMAAADLGDVDLLLSMPTVAVDPGVDPSGAGGVPSGTGPTTAATGAPQRSVTYNLDKAGNRLSVVDTGATKSYSPNILNQYTAAQGSTVTNGSEHELATYQGISYTYINDERLQTVTAGSNSYQLAYDALGRCVKRTVNGVTNYYIYDGEKAILSYNSSGGIVARNLYGRGIDEILMRADNVLHQTYYFQQDHEGSVTHLTDGTGTVIEKYKYDAFGAPTMYSASGTTIASSAYGNRFLFTGREYDSTFGIYEYRARAYHPGLGRFMSEDPKGFAAGDYNLFRYCHNDPEDLTDPMGLLMGVYEVDPRPPPPPSYTGNPFSGTSHTGYSIDKWGPPAAGRGLMMGSERQTQKTVSKDSGLPREDTQNGMKATQRTGEEYNKNNKPYTIVGYEVNGKHYETGMIEGKQTIHGNWIEPDIHLPGGAKIDYIGHWHMPGQMSFSGADKLLASEGVVVKNFDPVRGSAHINYYGAQQQYEAAYRGWIYHLGHFRDIIVEPRPYY